MNHPLNNLSERMAKTVDQMVKTSVNSFYFRMLRKDWGLTQEECNFLVFGFLNCGEQISLVDYVCKPLHLKLEKIFIRSMGKLFNTFLIESEENANKFMQSNKGYGLLHIGGKGFYLASIEPVKDVDTRTVLNLSELN